MTKEELAAIARAPVFAAGEMTERLIVEKQGPIGWLVFNNPERRNAISVDMWEGIPQALDRFEADPAIRAIVLAGAGDKAFVSGADISQFDQARADSAGVQRYEEIAEGAQLRLQQCDRPVLAMIRGFCLGGGLNIALACDLRIAADDARLGIPAARIGLGYRASSTKNLVDTIGPANAREILLTARQLNAAEALAMGLVNRVVPAAGLPDAVLDYCGMFADNAPLTMRTAKRIIRELLKSHAGFDAAACRAYVQECFESADYAEGRRAFKAKRRPIFSGK
jgi:enoyl-CoA hydratase/carnithine racemase